MRITFAALVVPVDSHGKPVRLFDEGGMVGPV